MNRDALLKPLRVRFVEPEDVEVYGGDWRVYDELQIIQRPAREVIELETEIGAPLAEVFRAMRANTAFGDLASAWLAFRMAGHEGSFEEFNPIIMLAEWERVPDDETPVDEGKARSGPAESPGTTGTSPTDTVCLPIMEPAA